MPKAIQPNDLISLRDDLPQHNLLRGRIGRVIQVFTPDEFEVEFWDLWDLDGVYSVTTEKVRLKTEQVTSLYDNVTVDEAAFWKLIEAARADSGGDIQRQYELLIDRLAAMPIADIFMFGDIFDKFHDMAYRRELWAAAYIIGGGCSDDGFIDFRAWLIAQGEKVFHDALRDPEILVDLVPMISRDGFTYANAEFEPMNYVDRHAYEEKTGEKMPFFPPIYPYPELTGEDWDDETVDRMYPKLVAKFEGGEDVQ